MGKEERSLRFRVYAVIDMPTDEADISGILETLREQGSATILTAEVIKGSSYESDAEADFEAHYTEVK